MLKIENLKKNYKDKVVLDGVTFNIDEGEIIALVGINGSGKSTMIEIICGVKKQNDGIILVDGKDLKDKKVLKEIKKSIGYMPQSFGLFNDLTVKENLEYLCAVYDLKKEEVVDNLIDKCFLSDKKDYLAQTLSGGYKQLLSLAGAIIHKPKLLILDEPTSAMDPLFRKQFWSIINELNKNGTTILVTTHYLEEINNCKKLLCLANHKIVHEVEVKDMFENGKFSSVEEVLNYYVIKE